MMLWARARFDQDFVQHNKLNKLQVEIFSKLSQSIKVAQVEIKTNVKKMDKTIDLLEDDGSPF